MKLEKHLFICTRCQTQSGEEGEGLKLQHSLKAYFKENHPDRLIRINKSGCLGKCSTGVNAVCYPEGKWFEQIDSNDESKLRETILK